MTVPTRTALEIPQTGLGQALGIGIQKGAETGLQNVLKSFLTAKRAADTFSEEELISRGFSPEEAALFKAVTVGGKTAVTKTAIERMQRERGIIPEEPSEIPSEIPSEKKLLTPKQQIDADIKREIASTDLGLTPKEKFQRQEGRFKINTDLFAKTEKSLRKFEQSGLKLGQLKRLNERGNLAKGLGRLNVNFKTGELRFPFLASPDTQLFVKTINDFLTEAKDSFGARVTNFEVDRFLKRLPSLANSEEGRRAILRQMTIINELNQLQEKGVVDAFDKAGGIRRIDFDSASRIGRKSNLNRINELKREFAQITTEGDAVKDRQVKQGTKLTSKTIQNLLRKNKGNVDAALKEATELGFDIGE